MLTAQDFIIKNGRIENPHHREITEQLMIGFAKYHTQKALEAARDCDCTYEDWGYDSSIGEEIRFESYDKDLLMSAYRLENIK